MELNMEYNSVQLLNSFLEITTVCLCMCKKVQKPSADSILSEMKLLLVRTEDFKVLPINHRN